MRSVCLAICFVLAAVAAFGQGGTGTITGTVTDPTGLAVAGANVQATNVETGVVYTAASTAAGNYAIPNLPVGTYTLTVKVQGFKTYTHTNLAIAAAQTVRQDVPMEIGAASESVTVEAQASLLQTETGDQTVDVTLTQMDNLPLLGVGTVNAGTSGYRNPYNTLLTLPGVSQYNSSGLFNINGLGGGSSFTPSLGETMRIEGQDATSRIFNTYDYTQMAQPNTDAVQEIAYQTSNYAPEYGQAGSAVINMTMKSGTNQYHGTGFDYFVNEDLNAADPFTIDAAGHKYRPINRRNDFGGTLGGPVIIPKLYNGKNKTFFFFAYEQYLEGTSYSFNDTVPSAAFRAGDFSAISANGTCALCAAAGIPTAALGMDALGRPIYANEIYDPGTRGTTAQGLGYANPFQGNKIPMSEFSPSSLAFLALLPQPQSSALVGNYQGIIHGGRYSAIPSIKVDEILSSKDKLSFYWDRNNTESQIGFPLGNADGLPEEIGGYRGTFIPTWITRLNYDRTISPTILLHLGAGYLHTSFNDHAPFLNFNPSDFDLSGFIQHRQFPSITGLCGQLLGPPGTPAACLNGTGANAFGQQFSGFGGMQNIGTSGQIQSQNYEEKPSFNANLTWVKGAHSFKFGAELYLDQILTGAYSGVTLAATGAFGTPDAGISAATAQPYVPTTSFNGYNMGFGFASFLLGDYTFANAIGANLQNPAEFYRQGYQQWGLFAQDSWKVRRNLTITYGARWDYATPYQEQYGRLGQLNGTLPNPSAGGALGAIQYASNCNCNFYKSAYPFAIGPRVGVAYQITPKTVFRGGWGFTYQYVSNAAGAIVAIPGLYPLSGVNPYVNIATPGAIATPSWPTTNPGAYPLPGTVGAPTGNFVPDGNENRPPRINQFSFSIQQEVTPNFILQAAFVGNRAAWLGFGPLGTVAGTGVNSNGTAQISPATYAQFGLYPYPGTGPAGYNNYADYLLTLQPLNSTAVQQRLAASGHAGFVPYAGFPIRNSLNSALYPFPQYGGITDTTSPTGDSKYDALQITATKRFSHGLQAGGTYTWGGGYLRPNRQNFFNPTGNLWQIQQIPVEDLNFNAIYTVPSYEALPKAANWAVKDWQVGWYANYQSGQFLTPPTSPTLNLIPSEDIRVPGQPLYTPGVNINDHSTFNPYTTQVLNPKAWAPCPANGVCAAPSTFFKDFRGPRTPTEDASIGRNFRFGPDGKFNLFIRAEFVNIFNRTLFPNPGTASPVSPTGAVNPLQHFGAAGQLTGGYGVINAYLATGTYYSANTAYLQGRTGTLIARFSF
ncbi:MAG TPA: TonB-dependent receptor [Bryobacteraceae bacterium]|nr:TonB-dependent receptor [Bryobacteraceae bacterium]